MGGGISPTASLGHWNGPALILEPDPGTAEALHDILSGIFPDITIVQERHGWRDALQSERFALVLIDVDTGGIPIEEVVRTARLRTLDVVCGAILGWWDEREADVRSWADCVVHKPVRPQDVQEAVLGVLPSAITAAA